MATDFELPAGDTFEFSVTVDWPGETATLAGATIKWSAAKSAKDTALISKSIGSGIVVTDSAIRTFKVTLLPADTDGLADGAYYHEAEITFADGRVKTPLRGRMTIDATLIRSV